MPVALHLRVAPGSGQDDTAQIPRIWVLICPIANSNIECNHIGVQHPLAADTINHMIHVGIHVGCLNAV